MKESSHKVNKYQGTYFLALKEKECLPQKILSLETSSQNTGGKQLTRQKTEERKQIFTQTWKLHVFLPMGRKKQLVTCFDLQYYLAARGTFVPAIKELSYIKRE